MPRKMSVIPLVLLALAGLAALPPAPAGAADKPGPVWPDPRTMSFPPLGEIQTPTPERVLMSNGMVVYLLEDHDFPLFDVQALIRVGSIYDLPAEVGLASITGEVMRTGGTASMPGDSLDRKLESMGASVEISFGNTDGRATIGSLSSDAEPSLRILGDLLRNPAFPQDKLDLAKTQEKTQIAARNDEAFDIAGREFRALIYGKNHPYARYPEYATIDAINRDALIRFHRHFVHPERVIMTIYGDFDSARMKPLLREVFGDWERADHILPLPPEIPPAPPSAVYLAPKEDMTNSMVLIGELGMRLDDPDYPAMALLNEILGGGGSNRLMDEIRTKRGLAYAAGSTAGAGYHHPGTMFCYAATQTDSTGATIGYMRHEIDRVLSTPVSEEEITRARDRVLNSLVFDLSSKMAVLNRMARYEFYDYPKDFLQKYQEEIARLTPDDLLAAAKRKIHPDELVTLVVGAREKVAPQLEALGGYKEIDLTIPDEKGKSGSLGTSSPGPAAPAASATPSTADSQGGRDLLARAVEAAGGDAVRNLKDFSYEIEGAYILPVAKVQVSRKAVRMPPNCQWTEQTIMNRTSSQAICGETGWMRNSAGVQDMPPEVLGPVRSGARHDLLQVLMEAPELKATLLPEETTVQGQPALVLTVPDNLVTNWHILIDRETHRIVGQEYQETAAGGTQLAMREEYFDFRDVGGIQWPYKQEIYRDGALYGTLHVTTAAANSGIDPALFKKPE